MGARLPLPAAVLTISLLSLAGFPPFGGFVGKTMLFGAALGAGWTWLAVVMGANVALSLYFYVRVIEPVYLRPSPEPKLGNEPAALRLSLVALALGTLMTGVMPRFWVSLAGRAASLLTTRIV